MKFYTNVQLIGNQFLVRGVENGKRFEIRDDFRPTLFIKTNKESKYKTLSGESVSLFNLEQSEIVETFIKSMMK